MYSFDFEITADDVVALQKHHLKTTAQPIKQLLIIGAVSVVLIVLALVLMAYNIKNGLTFFVNLYAGFFTLLLLFLLIIRARVRYATMKFLEKDENRKILGKVAMALHDTYITIKHEGSEGKLRWNCFYKCDADERYLYLYQTSNFANIIPLYKIKSDTSVKGIIDFIKAKITGTSKSSPSQP